MGRGGGSDGRSFRVFLLLADFRAARRVRKRPGVFSRFPLRRVAMLNPHTGFLHKSYSNLCFAASEHAWTHARAIARPVVSSSRHNPSAGFRDEAFW
jgi:hypothetical protein